MIFFWDTASGAHHPDYVRLMASAVCENGGALVTSADAIQGWEKGVRERLAAEHRLILLEKYSRSPLGWKEFLKMRRFMKSLPKNQRKDARIVHLEVSEVHLLAGLFAMIPWERGWISRVTGVYFKSKSLFEAGLGLKYKAKSRIIHFLLEQWIRALKPGTKMGFLTLAMYRHFSADPKLAARVTHIADPVPSFLPNILPDCDDAGNPCEERLFTVCMVGAHSSRKGTDFAVKALLALYRGPRLRCIVAGSLESCPAIKSLDLKANPDVEIIVDDRYIQNSEFSDIIRTSDICLLPYSRHFSPSAVLLVSAYWGTPVLASDIGQVADEVREYALGRLFHVDDPQSLVDGLSAMVQGRTQIKGAASKNRLRYLEGHSHPRFCSSVIDLTCVMNDKI